jgi:hypothetical protein
MNMNLGKETKFTKFLTRSNVHGLLIHGFILQILNVKIKLSSNYLQRAYDSKGTPNP